MIPNKSQKRMLSLLFLAFLLAFLGWSNNSQAQTFQWVQQVKRTNSFTSDGSGIAEDNSGNSYVTGWFTGTATFGTSPDTTQLTSAGGSLDIFVAKYNASGVLQWVQQAGGTDYDKGSGISVDSVGNVYVTGSFSGTATFGGAPPLVSAGSGDIFVAKYNTSGALQWMQQAGGTDYDAGVGISVDSAGNVYVTGSFSDTATFGTSAQLVIRLYPYCLKRRHIS